ncbi:AAA family ATPase [Marinigracilibium pacificum]|uniref:MoxR family ATPase n=1 Tax=Marinigracilibium pacificum TaxID=2729599 RepID=A0A848IVS4_9BACT|nr:MoxR family ATPase [Marinigracilibium pacificum]NMM48427.1 MoxR family ATPase [Marinigracilibium pacificum]
MSELKIKEKEIESLQSKIKSIESEVRKQIVGQQQVIDELLTAMLASGHALIEGVPGLAKTLLINSIAQAMDLKFKRIQFTPDLMPSDIIGTEVLDEDQESGKKIFKFLPGPIFANIILADEINRTPPKTQAALLEAMQEKMITYAGKDHVFDKPFFILATQNPIEQAGTFPLPEAQLDRFLVKVLIDYPTESEEEEVLKMTTGTQFETIKAVCTAEDFVNAQNSVKEVYIDDKLISQVNRFIRSTRPSKDNNSAISGYLRFGAGPRAGQALILTAKARAFKEGRLAVVPEDLKVMAAAVLRHRLLLSYKAEAENINVEELISKSIGEIGW